MNVTEFAERVVFGTTLNDKLLAPGKLTYGRPTKVPDVTSLRNPSRPIGLKMEHEFVRSKGLPHESTLENERARGQLLHFFANHELLATELMALVLLKFPDAPRQFRQGVLVTLQEEQEHTRMYIRRMKECEVEFGSYPLSGQFWRVVEPMKSPMDFVSRLSLTFEQANLDFSLHFSSVFRNIGDDKTADLLQKIYEDEITHVQHGLQWFRQWKDPDVSDWQAYQDSLEFPMSPARGRGPSVAFNRDGRKQAGLSHGFIDAIEVFRQSRGRRPTVRWFNPEAEAELSGELSITNKGHAKNAATLEQLAEDLELVMLAKSKRDDIVLVRKSPSHELRRHLIDAGFDLPEFMLLDDREPLVNRKLHHCTPWAWTPNSHHLTESFADSIGHQPPAWNDANVELFRKSWAAEKLADWIANSDDQSPDWLVDQDCIGIPISSVEKATLAIQEISKRGYDSAIVKKDLSSSGRGQRRFNCKLPLDDQDMAWLRAAIKTGQSEGPLCIIEPELNRVVDLSFLWHRSRSEQPRFLGWTRPIISPGRRYTGTKIGTNKFEDCSKDLIRFLLTERAAITRRVCEWLEPRISNELANHDFEGYFGVDTFVAKNNAGEFKIKPLVELNPRMTMGHIALSLEKRLTPGVRAEFRIFTKTEWDKICHTANNFPIEKVSKRHSRDSPWKSGVVHLAEPNERTKLVPAVIIGKQAISAIHWRLNS